MYAAPARRPHRRLCVRTRDGSRVRKWVIRALAWRARASRHGPGRYSEAGDDGLAAAGYQIQTTSSRFFPEDGARRSVRASSTQASIVRPTANGPVGAGKVSSVLCSTQSRPSSIATVRMPRIASAARPLSSRFFLNIRKLSSRIRVPGPGAPRGVSP
jgi:hypothetical protein